MKVGDFVMNIEQYDYMVAIYQKHAGINSAADYALCASLLRAGLVGLWHDGVKLRPELTHAGRIALARHLDPESRYHLGLAEAS